MSRAFKIVRRVEATEADLERALRVLRTAPAPDRAPLELPPGVLPIPPGVPLPDAVRTKMERSLGADLSMARVQLAASAPAPGGSSAHHECAGGDDEHGSAPERGPAGALAGVVVTGRE
jgi:hypothetical protein